MPANMSSFVGLFSSALLNAADQARRALFKLTDEDYADALRRYAFARLQTFLFELAVASWHVDTAPGIASLRAVRIYESLCDFALAFDADGGALIPASALTRPRVLADALESTSAHLSQSIHSASSLSSSDLDLSWRLSLRSQTASASLTVLSLPFHNSGVPNFFGKCCSASD